MRGADPDAGGSPYLAAKVDEARDACPGRRPAPARGAPTAVETQGRPRLLKG